MTDAELAALMSGDIDLDAELEESSKTSSQTSKSTSSSNSQQNANSNDSKNKKVPPNPPPPNDDSRMVDQLDHVTKDSERKASEILDAIDGINNTMSDFENNLKSIKKILKFNIKTFEQLATNFPRIEIFKNAIDKNNASLEIIDTGLDSILNIQDEIMAIMDKMQYQDIHRQKIERVINVMRSLALYMNHLFSSSIDDSKRVSSAKHIAGDKNDELVDEENLEALIASFGSKNLI